MPRPTSTDHTTAKPLGRIIVESVAAATDQEVTELQPLYEVVDSDALEMLIDSFSAPSGSVTFSYQEFEVTVAADRTVTLTPNRTGNEPVQR